MKVFCLFASVFLAASVAQAQTDPKLDTSVRNAAKIIPSVDLGQIIDNQAKSLVSAAMPSVTNNYSAGSAAGFFNAAAGKTLRLQGAGSYANAANKAAGIYDPKLYPD